MTGWRANAEALNFPLRGGNPHQLFLAAQDAKEKGALWIVVSDLKVSLRRTSPACQRRCAGMPCSVHPGWTTDALRVPLTWSSVVHELVWCPEDTTELVFGTICASPA